MFAGNMKVGEERPHKKSKLVFIPILLIGYFPVKIESEYSQFLLLLHGIVQFLNYFAVKLVNLVDFDQVVLFDSL